MVATFRYYNYRLQCRPSPLVRLGNWGRGHSRGHSSSCARRDGRSACAFVKEGIGSCTGAPSNRGSRQVRGQVQDPVSLRIGRGQFPFR
jgi:hypothetical protein